VCEAYYVLRKKEQCRRHDKLHRFLPFFPSDEFRRAQAVTRQHSFMQSAQFFNDQRLYAIAITFDYLFCNFTADDRERFFGLA